MKSLYKTLILIVCDTAAALLAGAASLFLTEGSITIDRIKEILPFFFIAVALMFITFILCGLYRGVLSYAGLQDCLEIAIAHGILLIIAVASSLSFKPELLRVSIVYFLLLFCLVFVVRFSYRFFRFMREDFNHFVHPGKKVIVIGAGDAGRLLVKEIHSSSYITYYPACFLDDDVNKVGMKIEGVDVFGTTDMLGDAIAKYHAEGILVAMPSVPRPAMRHILEKCRNTGLHTQILPGMYQLVNGEVHVNQLQDVSPIDLLGREQIRVNLDEIMAYIENSVVLVTGGGGSIGSELCRQIAGHRPKLLIILDIYENSTYDIEQELRRRYPELPLLSLIASIRDAGKIEDVFRTYRPNIVFNAAAHKHVPLMETSPNEAVKNNVFGTLNLARMADKYETTRFVQISTDKAVNPTNIMGATKRLCEMIIQSFSRKSKTEFVAVRFGNVLGSNGSVIPLFKKQIAEGGPVTVTHKDIIRYFMTIPEAVSLVLQAGAYAKGGEIFVLDMGEPVRIYDLAENMIRLSGLEPGVDIEIRCVGLRPGEKLYEERLAAEEGLRTTPNGVINIARPILFEDAPFFAALDDLYKAAYAETDKMKEMVAALVPTYHVDHTAEEKAEAVSATNQ